MLPTAVLSNRSRQATETQRKLFQNRIGANYFALPPQSRTLIDASHFQFYRKPCPTREFAESSGYAAGSALRLGVCVLHWVGMGLPCHAVLPY